MSENLILGILIFALFLDLLAFTLILPLFPSILEHFSKLQQKNNDPLFSTFSQLSGYIQTILNVPSLDRYNNVFFGGILGSLFSFLQFLSSPIFGAFSDKYGRKPLLLFAVFGSLISYSFWSISGLSFSLFFFSRLIGGLSKASISLAIAIVTDLLPDERRGKGMALVGACFSLAFIAGPSIGACLSLHGRDNDQFNSRPACLAITLTILEALILLIFLPETLKNNEEKRKNKTSKQNYSLWTFINPFSITNNSKKLEDIPSNKFLLNSISLIYFLFLLFFSALEFTLGFLTHIRFYYDSRQQGKLYLISGICMLLIQGVFVRRSPSTSKAQSKCALFGLMSIVPAYLFMAIANSEFLLYTGLLFYSISSATVVPSLTALFSRYCEQTQRGAFLGIFRSVGALSRAFGPLLGSTLFWMFGPTLSYSFGAICLLIPMFMFIKLRNNQKWTIEEIQNIKNK